MSETPRLKQSLPTLILALLVAANAWAGTKVKLGRVVSSGRLVSLDRIDHSPWDKLLEKYVDSRGLVDYSEWKRSADAVRELDSYLNALSTANPRVATTVEAKLAFWINAYNAVTIKGILREYPTTSIRNHTSRLWGYNIWHDLLLQVGGSEYSLHIIEHDVLRKLDEPRIHFAIVCASMGCPKLRNEAYTSGNLEAQLSDNARDFFSRSSNFRYDSGARRFYLSSVMKWFADDFGSSQAARLKSIAQYLPTTAAVEEARYNRVSVSYLSYNWKLNEQRSKR